MADTVVGKAVATLFVYANINSVYATMISKPAYDYLKQHDVDVFYKTIVPNILNRDKTDICPMEKAVQNIEDPDIAYETLKAKYNEMVSKYSKC